MSDAPELLPAFSTDELRRLRGDLRSHIPSDPTFIAAVSRILSHLVNADLAHPSRAARDEETAKAAEQQKADLLVARQQAEKDAATSDEDRAKLDAQHAAEQAESDRQKRLAALDTEQASQRAELARSQAAERAAAAA